MKEAETMFTSFGNEILEGTLSFKKFNKFFSTKKWRDDFSTIMQFVGMSDEKIKERFEQIQTYKSMDNIKLIVKVLLEIKLKNKMTEDFSILKDMDESVMILKLFLFYILLIISLIKKQLSTNDYHNKSFKEIDEKTMAIYQKLKNLSSKELYDCLRSFNENFEFIEWLRKVTPDLNALKLLCEFASESENEGALEVVRVQSLAMVGTAYSPLIFDIKPNFTYDQLILQVHHVNENLKKNPQLSEKIVRFN